MTECSTKPRHKVDLDLDPVAHTADVLNAHGSLRYQRSDDQLFQRLADGRARSTGPRALPTSISTITPTGGVLKGLKLTGGAVQLTDLGERGRIG